MADGLLSVGVRIVDRTEKILEAEDKASARIFRRSGGLVRGIARRRIRRTKKNSLPGKPPRTHVRSGDVGAKSIFWDYDHRRRILRVGPGRKPGEDGEVLEALEFSGMSDVRISKRRQRKVGSKTRRIHIKARPNTGPSGTIYERKYSDLYEGAI